MRCTENAHTAASNTKPTAHKALLLTAQLETVTGRENVVHHTQPTRTYNAPKHEQKTVQVKDSSTKPSYRQKPLPQPPKREGNSMNITCYECGQAGHIWTNCPHLMKVRTVAIRAVSGDNPPFLISPLLPLFSPSSLPCSCFPVLISISGSSPFFPSTLFPLHS